MGAVRKKAALHNRKVLSPPAVKTKPVKGRLPEPRLPEVNTKDRELDDMDLFWRSVDWLTWWEEFYCSVKPSGRPQYPSVYSFATAKAKSEEQRKFMLWYLGPRDEETLKYKFIPTKPLDWEKKRAQGGWSSPEELKNTSRLIKMQMDGLGALREAGNGIILQSFLHLKDVMARLNDAFAGPWMADNLDFKVNVDRIQIYLSLYHQVLGLQRMAEDQYAKALGINFEDMKGLGDLMLASAMVAQRNGSEQKTRVEKVVDQLVQMTLLKSHNYDMPLPEGMKDKVVEITATPVVEAVKKNVQ
jgi:hypothetical protein